MPARGWLSFRHLSFRHPDDVCIPSPATETFAKRGAWPEAPLGVEPRVEPRISCLQDRRLDSLSHGARLRACFKKHLLIHRFSLSFPVCFGRQDLLSLLHPYTGSLNACPPAGGSQSARRRRLPTRSHSGAGRGRAAESGPPVT